MMNPNLGGSITNDDWISEEEVADPKELPSIPGFHVLIRPVTAKKKTKGGIIIPSKLQDDLSYLTTVGRVLKLEAYLMEMSLSFLMDLGVKKETMYAMVN